MINTIYVQPYNSYTDALFKGLNLSNIVNMFDIERKM